MKIINVYLDAERYNPRIRATVPGAWIGEDAKGRTVVLCREYDAPNAAEALKLFNYAD